MVVDGKHVEGALHVPRQAVFAQNGKNHVFVQMASDSNSARSRSCSAPRAASASKAWEGVEIALVDPTVRAPGPQVARPRRRFPRPEAPGDHARAFRPIG